MRTEVKKKGGEGGGGGEYSSMEKQALRLKG